MKSGTTTETILDGIRVLDLGTMITAPLAAMMLAELGAEVIKVEHPDRGDPFRRVGSDLYSPSFTAYNRGKRSIQIDIRSPDGRATLERLMERSDVLIENYRPGVMDRLGLGEHYLKSAYPRLIHCSVTGFGATGPYSARPAYDTVGVAISGLSSILLNPAQPQVTGPTIADNVTGMYACYGILAALFERARSGIGRRVEVNMLETTIALIRDPISYFTQRGEVSGPFSRVAASQAFAFRCEDDKSIVVHLSFQEKFWQNFLVAISHPELGADERFLDRPKRIVNYSQLREVLENIISDRPRDYWVGMFERNDVPFAPVSTIAEVYVDPQVGHLGTFVEVEHPIEGKTVAVRRPVLIDGLRPDISPPPRLNEHAAEILLELDGKSANAVL